MTLLDEYQALPGEPEPLNFQPNYRQVADRFGYMVIRRDAIVRLLCRALRQYGHHPHDCDSLRNWADDCDCGLDALLTAVERDFPEEQGNG